MGTDKLASGGGSKRQSDDAVKGPHDGPRTGPGIGDVLLWGTLGCGALVILVCGVVGIGGGAWFLMARAPQGAPVVTSLDESTADAQIAPGELPEPPLSLIAPPPPPAKYGDVDLEELDAKSLSAAAHDFYMQGQFRLAVQFQYQRVTKTETGLYDLACYYALAGDVPAALFWLQDAARDDGVDVAHAMRDRDLIDVRGDPRWVILVTYLQSCQRYWESSGYSETSVVVPQSAVPGTPIPAFIGLHGFGSNASDFVSLERYQLLADEMGAAFLGVSGTRCRGKHTFVWSEDPSQDMARIDAALSEVAAKLTPAKGQLVLFGFSQGGMVSAELAARHPQRFAGAIVLSPGSVSIAHPNQLPRFPPSRRPGIVAVCGEGEHPDTVNCTKAYSEAYRIRGARLHLKLYPGMSQHAFPPDFDEKFPIWGKFVLDSTAKVPEW